MPRPNIIRADTHDLQSHDAPSTSDHAAPASGVAPSQAHALRAVSDENAQVQATQHHREMGKQEEDELERELADAEVNGDEGFDDDDDDMMDKMSSSPSIIDEDIDFEMVYALHTFNATVEGQANAAKGEHMVLLDDSNSYWWLVRIVRDGSIGYLPAEHIETPMERLARLNKHRNIDLATPMLSDSSPEKSKNPLKKAMRRRNTKNVCFTNPMSTTFVEASDYEYSDEEEEEGAEGAPVAGEEGAAADGQQKTAEAQKTVEEPAANTNGAQVTEVRPVGDTAIVNEDGVKMRPNPTPAALRHPDSAIFHDETSGTKKLTLTPNLLRDDSGTKEVIQGRTSIDKQHPASAMKRDELITSPPPGKDGKKHKKGSSVLGSLFKKRGKKGRKDEDDDLDEWLHSSEKQSIDSTRSADSLRQIDSQESARRGSEDAELRRQQERQHQEKIKMEREKAAAAAAAGAQAQGIRRVENDENAGVKVQLEENGRGGAAQRGPVRRSPVDLTKETIPEEQGPRPSAEREAPIHHQQQLNPQQQQQQHKDQQQQQQLRQQQQQQEQQRLQHQQQEQQRLQQQEQQRVQQHEQLQQQLQQQQYQQQQQQQPAPQALQAPGRKTLGERPIYAPSVYKSAVSVQQTNSPVQPTPSPVQPTPSPVPQERLSESPEQITFHDAAERPDLIIDTSSGADSPSSPSSPIDSSPELIERANTFESATSNITTTTAPPENAGHVMTRTWSDWSLRTYFEDDDDVRDMLIVVRQDKGDPMPEGKDHPEIMPLFEESHRRLADITKQLDGMLGDWLQRRAAHA